MRMPFLICRLWLASVCGLCLSTGAHGEEPNPEAEAVMVDLYSGEVLWRNNSYPWLGKVSRSVMYGGQLSYEVSSFTDFDKETGIHLVDTENGNLTWEKLYSPGMNHARQARAMFIGDDLWIQQGGKVGYENRETKAKFQPVNVTALDPKTGETKKTLAGGLGHCAPRFDLTQILGAGQLAIAVGQVESLQHARQQGR